MNITYKIENYYPAEQRCFVIYRNGELPPMGEWVHISVGMTESEIKAAVLAATPVYKWQYDQNTNISALVGSDFDGVYVAPVDPEPEPEPVVESPEPQVTPLDLETMGNFARQMRQLRLLRSDWSQLPDVGLTEAEKTAWVEYRQALRDVPEQSGFPESIIWPTAPN